MDKQEKALYHLVSEKYFLKFKGKKHYHSQSFEEEGFIHLCYESQIETVRNRHLKGVKDLLAIEIDPSRINAEIILEANPFGEYYPHLYATLDLEAVRSVSQINQ